MRLTCAFAVCLLLVLTGCDDNSSTATAVQPPVVNIGGPYTGTVGAAVSFGGSAVDPQGETLAYAWNFGDGATGTGTSPSHAYATAGTYTVTLTVTDTSNLTAKATSTATITAATPAPPVVNIGGPYTGTVGVAVNFSGSAVDPQGEMLTYAWNFGDGATGTGTSPGHTYATAGTYTVTLTVTDSSGLTATATSTATIVATMADGSVHEGQQAISGAHVYLFAANTTGYGQPSVSLLDVAATGLSDSIGAYVLTGADGSFEWEDDYSCTPGTQVYTYVLGGDSGSGTNSATGLLAALGSCPSAGNFSGTPYVWVNEVSTVATAYAMAGFATDATHVSSSGTALAQAGIANAFANAANLETLSSGVALGVTPADNGTVPTTTINTLANILAACVSSGSPASTPCSTLFASAESGGSTGTAATDTATAAINMAHNPGANIAVLYTLATTTAAFVPALADQPNDFTIGINFTGGGLVDPYDIAIDGSGNVWLANYSSGPTGSAGGVVEFSSSGAILSGTAGFTGGGLNEPIGIAIDASGNAWIVSQGFVTPNYVTEISSAGVILSGTGYMSLPDADDIAIDGQGDAWITSTSGIQAFSGSGTVLSGTNGLGGLNLRGIAIDSSGNTWIADRSGHSIFKLSVASVSSSAVTLSATNIYTGGGLVNPSLIAIDGSGNAWITDFDDSGTVIKLSSSGAFLSGTGGFTGGGLVGANGIAIDGAGNVWVSGTIVAEISNGGNFLSGANGYVGGGSTIAIDGSGDLWGATVNDGTVNELIGVATPVVTPLAVGVKNNTLGARP